MQQSTGTPYGATVSITINQFRALGSIFPISAGYSLVQASPGVALTPSNTLVVASNQAATLVFQLSSPGYVFVGATFDSDAPGTDVGTTEFPTVTINRSSAGNSLTINDANVSQDSGVAYSYILLVQNTVTGAIGIIDPLIINDPGP